MECYKAAHDVATQNRMAADETLQVQVSKLLFTILCWCQCQPYVLYQTIWRLSHHLLYSLLSLFDVCLLLLPLEDSLSCTIFTSAQQHIQQQQQKQPG